MPTIPHLSAQVAVCIGGTVSLSEAGKQRCRSSRGRKAIAGREETKNGLPDLPVVDKVEARFEVFLVLAADVVGEELKRREGGAGAGSGSGTSTPFLPLRLLVVLLDQDRDLSGLAVGGAATREFTHTTRSRCNLLLYSDGKGGFGRHRKGNAIERTLAATPLHPKPSP